jgi:hypothetical protein
MTNQIPLRILRAEADAFDPDPPELSPRQQRRRERVLTLAPILLARHASAISFTSLAFALRLDRAVLRFLFPDIPALIGEILTRHLTDILEALAALPPRLPNSDQQRQAAYRALTRTPQGNFKPEHILLLRDLAALPEDIREPLEHLNAQIPLLLARGNGPEIRANLDSLEETTNFEEPPTPQEPTLHDLDTTPLETVLNLFAQPSNNQAVGRAPARHRLSPPLINQQQGSVLF